MIWCECSCRWWWCCCWYCFCCCCFCCCGRIKWMCSISFLISINWILMMVILCIDRIFKGLPYVTPFSISIPFEWSHCYVVSFIFFFFCALSLFVRFDPTPPSICHSTLLLSRAHSLLPLHAWRQSQCVYVLCGVPYYYTTTWNEIEESLAHCLYVLFMLVRCTFQTARVR